MGFKTGFSLSLCEQNESGFAPSALCVAVSDAVLRLAHLDTYPSLLTRRL